MCIFFEILLKISPITTSRYFSQCPSGNVKLKSVSKIKKKIFVLTVKILTCVQNTETCGTATARLGTYSLLLAHSGASEGHFDLLGKWNPKMDKLLTILRSFSFFHSHSEDSFQFSFYSSSTYFVETTGFQLIKGPLQFTCIFLTQMNTANLEYLSLSQVSSALINVEASVARESYRSSCRREQRLAPPHLPAKEPLEASRGAAVVAARVTEVGGWALCLRLMAHRTGKEGQRRTLR